MPSARLAEFRKMPHTSGVPYSVVLFIVFLLKKLDACTLRASAKIMSFLNTIGLGQLGTPVPYCNVRNVQKNRVITV